MHVKLRNTTVKKCAVFGLIMMCLIAGISLMKGSDSKASLNANFQNLELQKLDSQNASDSMYAKIAPSEFSECMLDSSFEACFFPNTGKHPLIKILLEFSKFSYQSKIETILIEPSLLYCILSPDLKNLLLKRNFTATKRSSENVLTMAIFEKDVIILEKKEVKNQLAKIGFQIEVVEHPILTWMKPQTISNRTMSTSHVFLRKYEWTLHLVVFFERANYLWHAALPPKANSRMPINDTLLFVDADSAFEKFIAVPLGFMVPHLKNVNIPTKPASFLHQIEASRFLECNQTIVNLFKKQNVSEHPTRHQYTQFSSKEFNHRLIIALKELKINLDPLLIRFWVWSGTLLGWHRECDVIPFTTDADFATWDIYGAEIDPLMDKFKENKKLTATEKYGIIEEALEYKFRCDGLPVDLFFIYKMKNGTYCGSHATRETAYYIKYFYPFFSLCSAELLGQKVNIPCNPEGIVLADYGKEWIKPVSRWSYTGSVHNRGPDIFWQESLLDKVYKHY